MSTHKEQISKISRPKLAAVFQRKRLFKLLDKKRKHPAIWISGPAGAGKTTLITSYIESKNIDCLWYEVDARDTDPATFFYYMSLAAKKASPRKRKPVPLLTPEYMLGLDTFALRFFEAVYQRLSTPTVMVIDNYQIIPHDSLLHTLILNGLSVIPNGITVILVSRESPPPVFSRMLANQEMIHIGWQEVQLTLEETGGIARLQIKKTLPKAIIHQLHKTTDGWTAGLMLMLTHAGFEDMDWESIQQFTPQEIFDYFGKEVLEKVDPKTQDFLLKVSLLPYMTIHMAKTLTGHAQAGQILLQLNRNNQFTERRFKKRLSYQFHPLFREFLLSRLNEKVSEQPLMELCGTAAALLQDIGDIEEAAALLKKTKAWHTLTNLIIENALTLIGQGRNMSLLNWITSLPREMVQSSGWLLYWLGSCQSGFAPSESRPALKKAYQLFQNLKDPDGIAMTWCALEWDYFLECSTYSPLDWLIEEVFEFLPIIKDKIPMELAAMLNFHIFSALNLRQPQHPQMETYANQVDQLIDLIPDVSQRLFIGTRLAIYRSLQGEVKKTTRLVHLLKPLARDKTLAPFPRLAWLCGEASHTLTSGAFQECLQIVAEGEEITQNTGVRITEGTLLGIGAYALLGQGDCKKADEYLYRMARAILPGRFFEYAWHRILVALSLAMQGELGKALDTARSALDFALQSGSPLMELISRFGIGQLHTDLGDYQTAAEELEKAGNLGRALNNSFAQYMSLVYGAQLQFALGNEEAGKELLRSGLAVGREREYFFSLWDRHDVLTNLYVKAIQAEIETDYVQKVIHKKGLFPATPPFHLENWPWPLKIFTLGRFNIVKDGAPIKFTTKTQKKPLEMIKVLIALGGRDVSKEQISDVLWPQSDGDKASRAFITTLHRLRRLLDNDHAVQIQEGKLTLNSTVCWVDCWAFERLISEADEALNEDTEKAMELTEKALSIYKSAFLAGDDWAPWAVSQRERLRAKFIWAVDRHGKHLESMNQLEKAVAYYRRSLDADDISEETYQCLMQCLIKLGRKTEAISVYNRCEKTLHASLGMAPSHETHSIYQSIVNKE